MNEKKILVVEDDDGVRGLIRLTLESGGYSVVEAADGNAAKAAVTGPGDAADTGQTPGRESEKRAGKGESAPFALAILDIMLPGIDGYGLLPIMQAAGIPVIFLTAKVGLSDRVQGLKAGADDYITKPFEPLELLARVEALLRRTQKAEEDSGEGGPEPALSYGDIILNEASHAVTLDGAPVALTEKEYELLILFMKHPGQAFSREQILDSVWGYDYYGGTRTVDVHISALRGKLGLTDSLETVYKLGYRLKKLS